MNVGSMGGAVSAWTANEAVARGLHFEVLSAASEGCVGLGSRLLRVGFEVGYGSVRGGGCLVYSTWCVCTERLMMATLEKADGVWPRAQSRCAFGVGHDGANEQHLPRCSK